MNCFTICASHLWWIKCSSLIGTFGFRKVQNSVRSSKSFWRLMASEVIHWLSCRKLYTGWNHYVESIQQDSSGPQQKMLYYWLYLTVDRKTNAERLVFILFVDKFDWSPLWSSLVKPPNLLFCSSFLHWSVQSSDAYEVNSCFVPPD